MFDFVQNIWLDLHPMIVHFAIGGKNSNLTAKTPSARSFFLVFLCALCAFAVNLMFLQ